MISARMSEEATAQRSPAGLAGVTTVRLFGPWFAGLCAGWRWVREQSTLRVLQSKNRRLRVSETVSLGEKRFLSIVEVDGQAFLVGGSSVNVALLASLENDGKTPSFGKVLAERWPGKDTA